MPSKFSPWDFVARNPNVIDESKPGVYGLSFYDPFIQKLILDRLPASLKDQEDFRIVHAADLTVEWFENNFQTLSLFGTSESYMVIESQSLSTKVKDYLDENTFDLTDRFLIFVSKHDAKGFPKLEKMTGGTFYQVEAPKFWEGGNLLDFLAKEMNVNLAYDVKNFLIKNLENNCLEFVNALNLIQLHGEAGQPVDLEAVKDILTTSKLDQFELASLYGQKKRAIFFKTILDHNLDFEGMRGVFSFMQGHLFKMMDTSYIAQKKKPSKYDREIESHSRNWSKSELLESMKNFGQLEVMAKSKSPRLTDELRLKCLGHMG